MAGTATTTIDTGTITNVDCSANMALVRSKLALENKHQNVPLEDLRIFDSATNAVLPNTAAADDLGLDLGTFGTDGFTIQSSDAGGTTVTQKARFRLWLPAEYEAGGTLTMNFYAGMLTTISDTTATLDLECYAKNEADGTHGSDLCDTSATTINSLTLAAKGFTITPTSLTNGDELSCRITVAITDSGDLGVMRGLITKIYLTYQARG